MFFFQQESPALEAGLDNFIAEVLQSQLSLVQRVPSPDKSPKPLNTQSPTTNSPTAELGNYINIKAIYHIHSFQSNNRKYHISGI